MSAFPSEADIAEARELVRFGQETRASQQLAACSISSSAQNRKIGIGYSRSASARAKNASGILRPIFFALFRLTASSNFVGCSMGKSLGSPPCKILARIYAGSYHLRRSPRETIGGRPGGDNYANDVTAFL